MENGEQEVVSLRVPLRSTEDSELAAQARNLHEEVLKKRTEFPSARTLATKEAGLVALYVVRVSSGAIDGYLSVQSISGEPTLWYLWWLVVRPELRNRGLGRALLLECSADAIADGIGLLVCEAPHEEADGFWRRRGFTDRRSPFGSGTVLGASPRTVFEANAAGPHS